MKNLSIGMEVYHYGSNENSDQMYKVTITGFDRQAIEVKGSTGDVYWLNLWELTNSEGRFYI